MSTRANIVVGNVGWKSHIWFYQHGDGYPDGPIPRTLDTLKEWVETERIRGNASQGSGWLIAIGMSQAVESNKRVYLGSDADWLEKPRRAIRHRIEHPYEPGPAGTDNWQIGRIEPTANIHSDIEYLYAVRFTRTLFMKPDIMEWRCFSCGDDYSKQDAEEFGEEYVPAPIPVEYCGTLDAAKEAALAWIDEPGQV